MYRVEMPPRAEHAEIIRKYGNTRIGTLRKIYGTSFAPHCADNEELGAVLEKLDVASLCSVVRDHEAGKLKESAAIKRRRPAEQPN